jgi:hypothetical protein
MLDLSFLLSQVSHSNEFPPTSGEKLPNTTTDANV